MTGDHSSICCAGIDVSKAKLDIVILPGGGHLTVDYTVQGLHDLDAWLARNAVQRIGFEASGGYELRLLEHLRGGSIPAVRLQPAQVKAYGRAMLKRAKTDRLDAELIALFTASLKHLPELPDPVVGALAEHLTFIEQIEDRLAWEKTALETTRDTRLRRLRSAEIRRLDTRRDAEILLLAKAVRTSAEEARRLSLLTSIKGIGQRTALALIVRLPELGRISREEAAALAGVAPYAKDSGKSHKPRTIAGGRARLRKSLFMAAFAAAQWNPDLKTFYTRLRARGKHHLCALTATMRKLIILANAILLRGSEWNASRP